MRAKRLVSSLLAMAMVVTAFPLSVFAADPPPTEENVGNSHIAVPVEGKFGDQNYPQYGEEGYVRMEKSAHWLDYEAGTAQIDISVWGQGITTGSDVILITDRSGSMGYNTGVCMTPGHKTIEAPCGYDFSDDWSFGGTIKEALRNLNLKSWEKDTYTGTLDLGTMRCSQCNYRGNVTVSGTFKREKHSIGEIITWYEFSYENLSQCTCENIVSKHVNAEGELVNKRHCNYATRMNLAQQAANNFVDSILANGSESRIALISFAGDEAKSKVSLDNNFSKNANSLKNTINNYGGRCKGGTNYVNPLNKAIELVESREDTTRPVSIVFLSDGLPDPKEDSPLKTVTQLANTLKNQYGATIYTVGLGLEQESHLKAIATAQNPPYYNNVKDMSQLDSLYAALASDIKKAGTDAVIKDTVSNYFNVTGVSASSGAVEWNEDSQDVTWNLGTVEDNKATLSIKIQYNGNTSKDRGNFPTNADGNTVPGEKATISYNNFNEQECAQEVETPVLSRPDLTITKVFVEVNEEGQLVNNNQVISSFSDRTVLQSSYYEDPNIEDEDTDHLLKDGNYNVDAPETITLNGETYKLQYIKGSYDNTGFNDIFADANPDSIELNGKSKTVYFGYVKTDLVEVTFNKNHDDDVSLYPWEDVVEGEILQRIPVNGTAKKPTVPPTRTGYTFGGWYTDEKCDGEAFDFSTKIAENTTLHAKWVPNAYTITYYKDAVDVDENKLGTVTVESTEEHRVVYNKEVSLTKKQLNDKRPEGYGDGVQQSPETPITKENNNINVLYTKLANLAYTVNYYKDTMENNAPFKTEQGTGAFKEQIPYNVEENVPQGYTAEGAAVTNHEGKPVTAENPALITAEQTQNIVNVVYTAKAQHTLTVTHTYAGTKVEGSGQLLEFGAPVVEYANHTYSGLQWKLTDIQVAPSSETVTADIEAGEVTGTMPASSLNITFIYEKAMMSDESITVNYYGPENTLVGTEHLVGKYQIGEQVLVSSLKVDTLKHIQPTWTFGSMEPAYNDILTIKETGNVINVYYVVNGNVPVEVHWVDENGAPIVPSEHYLVPENTVLNAADYQKQFDGYTYNRVEPSQEITAVNYHNNVLTLYYKQNSYAITTEVENGTISESTTANHGEDITIEYAPKPGYKLASIIIDGEEIFVTGHESSFTFQQVKDDHTIKVVYEQRTDIPYTINYYKDSVATENFIESETGIGTLGTAIAPSKVDDLVPEGYTAEGVIITPENAVITEDETQNVVNVVYKKLTYTITTTAKNGTITGNQTVDYMGSTFIYYSPDEGYKLSSITIDGQEVPLAGSESYYYFVDVTSDHNIEVVYIKTNLSLTVNHAFYNAEGKLVEQVTDEAQSQTGLDEGTPFAVTNIGSENYVYANAMSNFPDLDVKNGAATGTMPDEDVTITFVYTAKAEGPFTVTFDPGSHGTVEEDEETAFTVPAGEEMPTAPEVVAEEGYIFIGWDNGYDSLEGTEVWKDYEFTAIYAPVGSITVKHTYQTENYLDGNYVNTTTDATTEEKPALPEDGETVDANNYADTKGSYTVDTITVEHTSSTTANLEDLKTQAETAAETLLKAEQALKEAQEALDKAAASGQNVEDVKQLIAEIEEQIAEKEEALAELNAQLNAPEESEGEEEQEEEEEPSKETTEEPETPSEPEEPSESETPSETPAGETEVMALSLTTEGSTTTEDGETEDGEPEDDTTTEDGETEDGEPEDDTTTEDGESEDGEPEDDTTTEDGETEDGEPEDDTTTEDGETEDGEPEDDTTTEDGESEEGEPEDGDNTSIEDEIAALEAELEDLNQQLKDLREQLEELQQNNTEEGETTPSVEDLQAAYNKAEQEYEAAKEASEEADAAYEAALEGAYPVAFAALAALDSDTFTYYNGDTYVIDILYTRRNDRTTPTPDPDPDDGDDDDDDEEDDDDLVTIDDEDVPLAPLPPNNLVTIIDEDVPLGALPQTGSSSHLGSIGLAAALCGALMKLFKKEDNE